MRKLLIAVLVTALAGVLAASALAAGRTVKVGDYFFVREGAENPTVRVSKGTKVTFKWVGGVPHNVVATSGPESFGSKTKARGYRFRHTFRKRGTYQLVCTVHPSLMRMKVRVR